MYRPAAFAVDDPATLDAFIDAHPFALIATADLRAAAPLLTQAPVMRTSDGHLVLHLAKPNPHCAALAAGAATGVVFNGPHGYVSPRWYAAAHAVPTWNYSAVHVHGTPEEITDRRALRAGIDHMLAHFESDTDHAPSIHEIVDDATIDGMLRGVRGFRIVVASREGKFKLSQNRSDADRAGVLNALSARGGSDALLADFMRSALDKETS